MKIETWAIAKIKTYEKNPRRIKPEAIATFAATIKKIGFRVPVLIKSSGDLIDGHFRLLAAREAGLTEIPAIPCDDLTNAEIKALRLSVNKVSELAEWDTEKLIVELSDLDIELLPEIGFSETELAQIFAVPEVDSQNPASVSSERLQELTCASAEDSTVPPPTGDTPTDIPQSLLNNNNPTLPIVPIYTEHHSAFIVLCDNLIDESWFREKFGLYKLHGSPTDVKTGLPNVITVKQVKEAL